MHNFWKKCKNRLRSLVCLQWLGDPPPYPRVVTSAYYYNFAEFVLALNMWFISINAQNKITTV